jgi:hypothetical protein
LVAEFNLLDEHQICVQESTLAADVEVERGPFSVVFEPTLPEQIHHVAATAVGTCVASGPIVETIGLELQVTITTDIHILKRLACAIWVGQIA